MKELRAVNKYILKYKWTFLLGFAFVALNNYFGSLVPVVIKQAVDMLASKEPASFLGRFSTGSNLDKGILLAGGLIMGLTIIRGIFLFLQRQMVIVNSHKIVADMRHDIYNHYQNLDQVFYKKNQTGDLMSRVADDVSRVRGYIGPALMYIANTIALFIFVPYQMIKSDASLTLWTMLPLPVLSISVYFISSVINKKSEKIQRQLSTLTSNAQETFSGVRVIKSYAGESHFKNIWENDTKSFKDKTMSLAKTEAFFFPLIIFLIGLSTLIMLYVGASHYAAGKIDSGVLVQFIIYIGMLTWPVIALGWVASTIQKAAASQKRINEFMSVDPIINNDEATIENVDLNGDITFEKVSFTYPDSGIEALKNVSFTVKKGEKVAIIGKTGSGKTTIADLLLRVFTPTNGEISLNNHSINKLPYQELRQFIGYVPQDVFLFSDTIYKNINLGAERNISREEAAQYAKKAAVDKDIIDFPKQYDTLIGERGVTLSGGQKQRISIARALVKNPSFLILDDALSAVDAKTEHAILNEFKSELEQKTVIIITHRVFTLFDVDRILVLDNGVIAEEGTHESLYEKQGLYYELFEMQRSEESFTA